MEMNLHQSIELAEREAARGCGQSDILYEKRVQESYRAILERSAPEVREYTEAELRKRGFDPNFVPYEAGHGKCGLTGIEIWCCPCGRHE